MDTHMHPGTHAHTSTYQHAFSVLAPGRLRDLKVTVKDENRTSLLTWKKPKDGGKPDTYKVEYSADDRKFKPVSVHVCTCVHTHCSLRKVHRRNLFHVIKFHVKIFLSFWLMLLYCCNPMVKVLIYGQVLSSEFFLKL